MTAAAAAPDHSPVHPDRKPAWLFPRPAHPAAGDGVRRELRGLGLATVCESACCPNRGECFAAGTATFLILGPSCTRRCSFCAVGQGTPSSPDPSEPAAVARGVRVLGLGHAVVTSVTRDDLPDGGAAAFAATVRAIRADTTSPSGGEGRVGMEPRPSPTVEVLVPDFRGSAPALEAVLASAPEVLAHNVETVPRLYGAVRAGASYGRSLELLRRAAAAGPGVVVKSGLMAGLGEEPGELVAVMRDLAAAGVAALSLGQYLQPRHDRHPVARYLEPAEFAQLAAAGRAAGIAHVTAGPLVRSSWRAGEALRELVAGVP